MNSSKPIWLYLVVLMGFVHSNQGVSFGWEILEMLALIIIELICKGRNLKANQSGYFSVFPDLLSFTPILIELLSRFGMRYIL